MYEANVIDVANTEHLTTGEVLMDQIGNYASKELEEQYATDWETTNSKALIRSWEERGDGKHAATYLARKKHFDAIRTKKPKLGMSMAPELAKEELERYARIPASELAKNEEHQRRINDLRAVLSLAPLDFKKAPSKIEQPDYEAKVAEYLKLSRSERTALVVTLQDRTLLGYIGQDDPEREVRELAQKRLLTLAMGG